MLLVHQAGSVKVGEVVRYTLSYTPSNDRILPTPKHLHLKVKNTSAIPLRAAWVHGPYALHVSAYPSTFNPHRKVENPKKDGAPEYEPMVKAGGSWSMKLLVPDDIRETGADLGRRRSYQQGADYSDKDKGKVTWTIEIASQILFSNSASVGFEVLVGRDERSLELGFAAVAGAGHGAPAHIKELQGEKERKEARKRDNVQHEGVYSKAVRLVVEDTDTLWDKPPLPSWDDEADKEKKGRKSLNARRKSEDVKEKAASDGKEKQSKKRRNVHLVILTHGLHSNLGADMLFLKESIDATVAQARADAKKRKEQYRAAQGKKTDTSGADEVKTQQDGEDTATAPLTGGQDDLDNAPEEDDEEEETIVRGFNGNAVKTENGIQYLGKRLAKYILRFTYPDQPFLPIHRNLTRKFTDTFTSEADKAKRDGKPAHQGSSVATPREARKADELAYKFTSISFVGHSLGGLIQTYAVAYIHKHSPTFFQQIKPVNFICLASPMLGLSNENPMYVKFALDFGLVGRTGQDLGLTWRAPTIANKGWNAMGSIFTTNNAQKEKDKEHEQADAAAKPLLRILPTGPAHQVLRMFRNRTVYSNVVNDGIVPLRTSCLLFLDWRGLGKVDKARRENGLIGTVAEWGWAELTGANSSALGPNMRADRAWESEDESSPVRGGQGDSVPQPAENETTEDSKRLSNRMSFNEEDSGKQVASRGSPAGAPAPAENKGMMSTVMSWFGANTPAKPTPQPRKTSKILRRGQTMNISANTSSEDVTQEETATTTNPTIRPHLHSGHSQQKRPIATRGDSLTNPETGDVMAPPRTSIFESAGDILSPPLPSRQWICDPSTRDRTIFHDRVYHPEDIPPPPSKKDKSRQASISSRDGSTNASTVSLKSSDTTTTTQSNASTATVTNTSTDTSGMKVEEKIARAYHRDLSWRKVLVRLEPDAHNNIIVRRMFANAYGWPVVKHLCDTHFADTHAARTRDEDEPARERAQPMDAPISSEHGEQVIDQTSKKGQVLPRTKSETREARDELADLAVPQDGVDRTNSAKRSNNSSSYSSIGSGGSLSRKESAVWDDAFFEGSDGEDSDAVDERNLVAKILNPNLAPKKPEPAHHRQQSTQSQQSESSRSAAPQPIQTYTDGHRGLAPYTPGSPTSPQARSSPTSPRFRNAAEVKQASPQQAAVKSTFNAGDVDSPPMLSGKLVEEPAPITPTSPTAGSMGLRKSVEEQVSSSSPVAATKTANASGSNNVQDQRKRKGPGQSDKHAGVD
ncbi:Putative alpha/Beta hydrolase, lipase [Septoria linicola]|uniref:Alpha/Beta hydrolase, lipase n=1 Tax=Septoria linicola TaxID=215465 RepID=A0A9Q9AU06_9PEZI|nr:putative alpha/Beta hydrolase, lipase [Septoria linicola]USW55399.1 Putative alpha/Beta hydrolase, lipase [Septoria linicola]